MAVPNWTVLAKWSNVDVSGFKVFSNVDQLCEPANPNAVLSVLGKMGITWRPLTGPQLGDAAFEALLKGYAKPTVDSSLWIPTNSFEGRLVTHFLAAWKTVVDCYRILVRMKFGTKNEDPSVAIAVREKWIVIREGTIKDIGRYGNLVETTVSFPMDVTDPELYLVGQLFYLANYGVAIVTKSAIDDRTVCCLLSSLSCNGLQPGRCRILIPSLSASLLDPRAIKTNSTQVRTVFREISAWAQADASSLHWFSSILEESVFGSLTEKLPWMVQNTPIWMLGDELDMSAKDLGKLLYPRLESKPELRPFFNTGAAIGKLVPFPSDGQDSVLDLLPDTSIHNFLAPFHQACCRAIGISSLETRHRHHPYHVVVNVGSRPDSVRNYALNHEMTVHFAMTAASILALGQLLYPRERTVQVVVVLPRSSSAAKVHAWASLQQWSESKMLGLCRTNIGILRARRTFRLTASGRSLRDQCRSDLKGVRDCLWTRACLLKSCATALRSQSRELAVLSQSFPRDGQNLRFMAELIRHFMPRVTLLSYEHNICFRELRRMSANESEWKEKTRTALRILSDMRTEEILTHLLAAVTLLLVDRDVTQAEQKLLCKLNKKPTVAVFVSDHDAPVAQEQVFRQLRYLPKAFRVVQVMSTDSAAEINITDLDKLHSYIKSWSKQHS